MGRRPRGRRNLSPCQASLRRPLRATPSLSRLDSLMTSHAFSQRGAEGVSISSSAGSIKMALAVFGCLGAAARGCRLVGQLARRLLSRVDWPLPTLSCLGILGRNSVVHVVLLDCVNV